MVNDSIADLLTRLRNASLRLHKQVDVPQSKMSKAILEILKENNYVGEMEETEVEGKKFYTVKLNYQNSQPAFTHIKRVSKPGLRTYVNYREIPKVLNGLGMAVISTSKGVMTGEQAKQEKIGGEYLCEIW